jgi:hypothetical protein
MDNTKIVAFKLINWLHGHSIPSGSVLLVNYCTICTTKKLLFLQLERMHQCRCSCIAEFGAYTRRLKVSQYFWCIHCAVRARSRMSQPDPLEI